MIKKIPFFLSPKIWFEPMLFSRFFCGFDRSGSATFLVSSAGEISFYPLSVEFVRSRGIPACRQTGNYNVCSHLRLSPRYFCALGRNRTCISAFGGRCLIHYTTSAYLSILPGIPACRQTGNLHFRLRRAMSYLPRSIFSKLLPGSIYTTRTDVRFLGAELKNRSRVNFLTEISRDPGSACSP